MRDLKKARIPQEDQQSQLTYNFGVSQKLIYQPKCKPVLDLGPLHTCNSCAARPSFQNPNNEVGAVPESVA